MTGWIKLATVVAVAAILATSTGGAAATSSLGGGTKTSRAATRGAQSGLAVRTTKHSSKPARATAGLRAARRETLLRHANLATLAGAKRYLRAIGVDPSGVVIQRGPRNYAGPACPGAQWACASTTHPVVQLATAGGKNSFFCTSAHCAVAQGTIRRAGRTGGRSLAIASATNSAKCIKTTGLTQSCSISQGNASSADTNEAIVYMSAGKMSGLTQTASYTASITQTAGAGANRACVFQNVNIDGSTQNSKKGQAISVNLNATQSVSVIQNSMSGGNSVQNVNVSPSGSSFSCGTGPLAQTQTLSSNATGAGSITQNENAGAAAPNVLLDIEQNQGSPFFGNASGANSAAFTQTATLGATAVTPVGPVNQTQSATPGGISAKVNQYSHDQSTANATQTETECANAQTGGVPSGACSPGPAPSYTLVQKQVGPVKKGTCPPECSTQSGNNTDTFSVTQNSTLNNQTGTNQTNFVSGDFNSSGPGGTVTQTTTANGSTSTNTQTGSNVNTQTNCSGSSCMSTGPTSTPTFTPLPNGFSVTNTDIGGAVGGGSLGGMRGSGTGTLSVNNVTGPVSHAFLYWNGPTNSADPNSNAAVTFAGTPISGTNIGTASDNCWGFANSQSYRADVTSLVPGNGTYTLSDFLKADADINGVTLLVFYNDANSGNDRNVVLWNGNDSNITDGTDPAGWDETVSGVQYPGAGTALLGFVVSDGQSYLDDALVLNGNTLFPAGHIFDGNHVPGTFNGNPPGVTGNLWDLWSFDMTSFLTAGSNTLHLTSGVNQDCLSLVALFANTPATGPVIP